MATAAGDRPAYPAPGPRRGPTAAAAARSSRSIGTSSQISSSGPGDRPSLLHLTPLPAMAPNILGRSAVIKVSFAASRPEGAYALAVPVRSEEMVADRLGGLDAPARAFAVRPAAGQRLGPGAASGGAALVEEGGALPPPLPV